jgi:hypothetical protein
LERRELEEEKIIIPPIHITFPKVVYVAHSEDAMDVPTQGLAIMGINTLERDGGEVKSYNEMAKEEELLPQLIVYTVNKMSERPLYESWKMVKIPELGDSRSSYSL